MGYRVKTGRALKRIAPQGLSAVQSAVRARDDGVALAMSFDPGTVSDIALNSHAIDIVMGLLHVRGWAQAQQDMLIAMAQDWTDRWWERTLGPGAFRRRDRAAPRRRAVRGGRHHPNREPGGAGLVHGARCVRARTTDARPDAGRGSARAPPGAHALEAPALRKGRQETKDHPRAGVRAGAEAPGRPNRHAKAAGAENESGIAPRIRTACSLRAVDVERHADRCVVRMREEYVPTCRSCENPQPRR